MFTAVTSPTPPSSNVLESGSGSPSLEGTTVAPNTQSLETDVEAQDGSDFTGQLAQFLGQPVMENIVDPEMAGETTAEDALEGVDATVLADADPVATPLPAEGEDITLLATAGSEDADSAELVMGPDPIDSAQETFAMPNDDATRHPSAQPLAPAEGQISPPTPDGLDPASVERPDAPAAITPQPHAFAGATDTWERSTADGVSLDETSFGSSAEPSAMTSETPTAVVETAPLRPVMPDGNEAFAGFDNDVSVVDTVTDDSSPKLDLTNTVDVTPAVTTATTPSPQAVTSSGPFYVPESISVGPQVVDHIVGMRQSIENGHAELELQLDPPELGKITIELTETNETLAGKLIVSSHTTLDSLRDSLASILDSLSEMGLSFDDLQLESSERDHSQREDGEPQSWQFAGTNTENSMTRNSLRQRALHSQRIDILA